MMPDLNQPNHDQQRKTRYVNAGLQGHLMWRMVVYWMVYNAVLVVVIGGEKLFWMVPDVMTGQSSFDFSQFIATFFSEGRSMFVAMAVFCPALIWDMLKYSHRIAGPLYRFRSAMEDHVAGKELKGVQLRDNDLLKEFQLTFNDFVEQVNKQKQQDAEAAVSEKAEPALQSC